MGRLTKEAWLTGTDLIEKEVDVPELKGTVKIRALPAAYSNQASSEALELKTQGSEQVATINTDKLEVLQFAHGVIEPEFSEDEAKQISEKYGPAFKRVINAIDEISGVDKEELAKTQARFQKGSDS